MHSCMHALASTKAGAEVPGENLIAPRDSEDWVRRAVPIPHVGLAPAQLVPALPLP